MHDLRRAHVAKHPPSARRAVIRRLKNGEHPVELAKEAAAIDDAAQAAIAMLHLAEDERMPADKAAAMVRRAADELRTLDRPGRMAESWGDALAQAANLDRGPETQHAVERLQRTAVSCIAKLPDGEWVTHSIIAAAPHLDPEGRRLLLRRALRNKGGALDAAKALLAQDQGLADIIRADAPPEVATRLLAKTEGATSSDAVAAAWAIEDLAKRREALRVLSTKLEERHELMALGGSCKGKDPADQVACWTLVGARLDRLGQDAADAFGHAARALEKMQGPEAVKAHRKLSQAMERSNLEPPAAPDAPKTEAIDEGPVDIPVKPLSRHAFTLVDGYTGGLGAPHLRAVARAAPLCMAFNLDLVLMGFPTTSAAELVDLVDAESNVGEDGAYARQLLEADRLHVMPLQNGLPVAWPGTPVATTPHPEAGKGTELESVEGPVCLLIGQGKQGLPTKMLHATDHHHELTGKGISMETATAMGILADRLGRIPV